MVSPRKTEVAVAISSAIPSVTVPLLYSVLSLEEECRREGSELLLTIDRDF